MKNYSINTVMVQTNGNKPEVSIKNEICDKEYIANSLKLLEIDIDINQLKNTIDSISYTSKNNGDFKYYIEIFKMSDNF